jgi:hypothetical protein
VGQASAGRRGACRDNSLTAFLGLGGVLWQWQQTREALARAETNLYFQRIALADREWQENNVPRAEALLDECPPGLRG